MASVQQSGRALRYAAQEMKLDRDVVMAAVQQDGGALRDAAEEMKREKDVVMVAVQQKGKALRNAAEEMKRDKDVAMAAVQQDGGALRYAAAQMLRDREVVMTAVRQKENSITYAPTDVQQELQVDADYFGVSVRSFCVASTSPPTVIQTFPRRGGDGDSMQISCVGVDGEEVMVFPLTGNADDSQQLRSALATSVGVSPAALQIILPLGSRLRDWRTTPLADLMAGSV